MSLFDELYIKIENLALENKEKNFFLEDKIDKNVILYGAGGNCEFAMFTCGTKGVPVTYVCDSKLSGKYKYKNQEYDIISPEVLIESHRDASVLITSWKYEGEIKEFLLSKGFPEENIYFLRSPLVISPEEFREKYLDGYRWMYNIVKDERSKRVIIDRIKMFLLGAPSLPDSLCSEGYFAFPDIKLSDNEVYIDGGAYIGDTAIEFIEKMKKSNKRIKHIYSFEPDEMNYKIASQNLSKYENIEIVPFGLWSQNTTLNFKIDVNNYGIGSCIDDFKKIYSVPVVAIDNYFTDIPQDNWPTLIKMDIEGAEDEALLGAKNVILKNKPKLIICAYHKPQHIYQLLKIILNIRSDYKFSLWQIGESFWDCILYLW